LVVASVEIGLEVNADRSKDTVMSHVQNAGRFHNIKIDNSLLERGGRIQIFGKTVTNQNFIQEEIKSD